MYNWGDCARYAVLSKYFISNNDVPPSVAEAIILGAVGATFYVIGVGLLYGVTGTLNMGDLAQKIPAGWDLIVQMHVIF